MNRPLSALVSLTLLTVSVTAQATLSPLGTWHGKMVATFTPPPPPASAQGRPPTDNSAVKKKVEEDLAKVRITVVVKKGGTYSATSVASGGTITTTGKWTLKGRTFSMRPDKMTDPATGKPVHDQPRVGTIAANGKMMIVPMPPELIARGIRGQIIFIKS